MSAVAGRTPLHVGGLSDEDLVALARSGHEPAFDVIVQRYRGPLVSYCRRWVDAHRAEEVVQHTLMKAFLCLRDDDRPLALRPWLYRVAHNAALNALEKKGSDWEELDENYDGVPQPPYVAEQRARFLRVVGGIEALPTRQREALLLNEFEGRCYADIATELGTSESGVRGLLRRARRQLRETAAVLLPFPAVRELLRSDGGRALQVDRAGELVGSAGAVGGVGAAGGLTKIAAGVLAAGTIAGGGTAIEQRDGAWRAPSPDVAAAAEPRPADRPVHAAPRETTLVVAAPAGDGTAIAMSHLAFDGGQLVAAASLPSGVEDGRGGTLSGIEGHQEQDSGAGNPEPDPILTADPPLPLSSPPKQEPAGEQEPAAGEDKATEPKKGSESPDSSAGSGDSAPEDGGTSDGDGASNPPATPAAPVPPQRF